MKRIVTPLIAILLLVGGGWFLFLRSGGDGGQASDQGAKKKKPVPAVAVVKAGKKTMTRTIPLTGSVEPVRVAALASPAEGPVQDLKVREGDTVKKGDLLLLIGRQGAAEASLAAAREELRKAEEEYRRTEQLVESKAIARDRLDAARVAWERAKSTVAKAEESTRDYNVVAPWDGIIGRVLVNDGNYVSPRASLIRMYDPAKLVVRSAVPERHVAQIVEGMKAKVALDAYPGEPFDAVLSRAFANLDRRMRTRIVEFSLANAPNLLPGMFARIELTLGTVSDVLAVPREAVLSMPDGGDVAYVVKDGKAERRKVTTGMESEGLVQILSGLQAGESVVTAGNEKLKPGTPVKIVGQKDQGSEMPPSRNSPVSDSKDGGGS